MHAQRGEALGVSSGVLENAAQPPSFLRGMAWTKNGTETHNPAKTSSSSTRREAQSTKLYVAMLIILRPAKSDIMIDVQNVPLLSTEPQVRAVAYAFQRGPVPVFASRATPRKRTGRTYGDCANRGILCGDTIRPFVLVLPTKTAVEPRWPVANLDTP